MPELFGADFLRSNFEIPTLPLQPSTRAFDIKPQFLEVSRAKSTDVNLVRYVIATKLG